ncbi:MAG: hypothetical protein JRN54_00120, partial [Nitrososphaerota archaeon]|nr:hypothetical protein [Nitrososphaerota archaeon]
IVPSTVVTTWNRNDHDGRRRTGSTRSSCRSALAELVVGSQKVVIQAKEHRNEFSNPKVLDSDDGLEPKQV